MKLSPFILAVMAIASTTPMLAGQGDAPSNVPAALAANAPGVSDTEIKIGQTMPYSGPLSGYGTIGRAELADFKMINDFRGTDGRKLISPSRDDGYSPPKTVEQIPGNWSRRTKSPSSSRVWATSPTRRFSVT